MNKIIYSSTFNDLLDQAINYLTPYSSEKLVIERVIDIINKFERRVADNPKSVQISPQLSSLGMSNFREFVQDGFRILYRIDESANTVNVAVFYTQKQDLPQILIDYCLLYK